jgi:N-acetylglutamate synthase
MDGRLVGAVLCSHDGRRGFIYHTGVAADCRHRGIASRMAAFNKNPFERYYPLFNKSR